MSTAMLSLGDHTGQKLERGDLEQILIKGEKSYILMTYAGNDAVITVLIKANARLDLIFLNVK